MLAVSASFSSAAEKQFRAGAFAIDVTPLELPVIVNGGMTERLVDKVEDRLHARCLVLDDGTTQLAIVIVDSCMMPRDLLDEAKRLASAATKIPPENMLIAATHCHSAPSVFGCLGSDADEKYSKFLPVQIAKGIAQAHANLQPARIGWAVGRDDKNVASRRWLMKPGVAPTNAYSGKHSDRAMMHPGPANKGAIAAVGIIDADVPIVSVQTKDGQPLAVLTNYSLHYVGAPNLSADYFSVVCEKMAEHLKPAEKSPFVAMHSNGTSGDQWLMDYTKPRREFDRFKVAADVATAAFEAHQRIFYYDWVPLVMAQRELEVGIRQPNAEELAEAKKLVDTFQDRKPKTVPEVYAREAVLLSEMPAKRKIVLQALRIGELGIAAIPNEVFSSTGLQIKIESPTPTTFTIELANGAEGYIPPPKQHKLGGYETWRARSSCLEVNAEPKIRAAVLELLNKVNDARAEDISVLAADPPKAAAREDRPTSEARPPNRIPKAKPKVATYEEPKHVSSTPVLTTVPPNRVRSPLSPEAALKHFQLRKGLKIELVASEPLIVDPVAFDWGYDGKLWVVEMHDYPNGLGAKGPDDKGPPGGRVKVLEDTNGDGKYDKATTFADKLAFPNGIMVLPDGGVLVTSAPQIVLLKDTDNDGASDKSEVLFSGFAEGNQQLRVNGLRWGIDGWIYCANGGVGRGDPKARIKVERTGELIDVGGRDFRFSLDYKKLEPQLGMSQFGRNCDDFGNWFGCSNNTPLYHIVHDDAMLRRNPHLVPEATTVFVPQLPKPGPVYAISEKGIFYHASEVGRFTSANSAMIYRDRLLGDEFYGNFFVSEPVHNLVHREIVARKGVTFTSARAPDEQDREFLASDDTWFRPNMIRTGPDGALYISDMYREIIEHPGWIQPEKKAGLTFRNGDDRGRIWRIAPEGITVSPIVERNAKPRSIDEQVEAADRANGEAWSKIQRFTLTFKTGDGRKREIMEILNRLASSGERPTSRLTATWTLKLLDKLDDKLLLERLKDQDAGVRAQAVVIARDRINTVPAIATAVRELCRSERDAAVKFQLAYALGGALDNESIEALRGLIDDDDPYVVEAALTSVSKDNLTALASPTPSPALIPTAIGYGNYEIVESAISWQILTAQRKLLQKKGDGKLAPSLTLLAKHVPVAQWPKKLSTTTLSHLAEVTELARSVAGDPAVEGVERVGAIALLGYSADPAADTQTLVKCLAPQSPSSVQQAAVKQLSLMQAATLPETVTRNWSGLLPGARAEALDGLLARDPWTIALLDSVEKEAIRPSDFDAARRQRLLNHPNPKIKERAAKLLAVAGSEDRQKVLADWAKVLEMKGDAVRGKEQFTKRCANCHKYNNEGQNVGPDLNTLTDRSPKTLLAAVLDPNAAVEPKYQAYTVATSDGKVVSGMLVEETGTSLTLADAGGKLVQVPRASIEELKATGKSLMPDGLERDLSQQDLADILQLIAK